MAKAYCDDYSFNAKIGKTNFQVGDKKQWYTITNLNWNNTDIDGMPIITGTLIINSESNIDVLCLITDTARLRIGCVKYTGHNEVYRRKYYKSRTKWKINRHNSYGITDYEIDFVIYPPSIPYHFMSYIRENQYALPTTYVDVELVIFFDQYPEDVDFHGHLPIISHTKQFHRYIYDVETLDIIS